jgi:hypothetical protein
LTKVDGTPFLSIFLRYLSAESRNFSPVQR